MKECPELQSIPRSDWMARNATAGLEYLQLPVNFMVFTHTYGSPCNSPSSCLPLVKQIQDKHMEPIPPYNFSDIGYHFLIGGDGSIFEAREWHIKGAFNLKYNSWGFGTAFLGKFSVEGDDFHELSYEAALSAHKLFQCALRNNYPSNYSVVTSRINPMIRNYILDPELLRPSTLSTTSRSTTSGSHEISTFDSTTSPAESTGATQESRLFTDEALAGMAVGAGILAFLVVFLAWYFCRCRKKDKIAEDYRAAIHRIVPQYIVARYEKPRWSIDLQDICVEMGHRAETHRGTLMDNGSLSLSDSFMAGLRPVAIKTLREGCNDQQTTGFLETMSILMKVGRHANIVNLEGVVLQGKLMMAIERCELGSLENYLIKLKTGKDEQCIVTTELTNVAHQICRGMEFLSCKGIIHGDLAARNILLDAEKTAKISDFGMRREQFEYVHDKKVPLPVYWMAPESFIPEERLFSTQSDVWSFGVLLWEIFTIGCIPYASEFPNGVLYGQLCTFLFEGHRMRIPQRSPESIGRLMTECWNLQPKERPGFPCLRQTLEILLPVEERGRYITCHQQIEELSNGLM